jgi:hypothetical protein
LRLKGDKDYTYPLRVTARPVPEKKEFIYYIIYKKQGVTVLQKKD